MTNSSDAKVKRKTPSFQSLGNEPQNHPPSKKTLPNCFSEKKTLKQNKINLLLLHACSSINTFLYSIGAKIFIKLHWQSCFCANEANHFFLLALSIYLRSLPLPELKFLFIPSKVKILLHDVFFLIFEKLDVIHQREINKIARYYAD